MNQDRQEFNAFDWSQWIESAVGFWVSAAQSWQALPLLVTDGAFVERSIRGSLSLWRAFQAPWTFKGSCEAKGSPVPSFDGKGEGMQEAGPGSLSGMEVENVAGAATQKAEPVLEARPEPKTAAEKAGVVPRASQKKKKIPSKARGAILKNGE